MLEMTALHPINEEILACRAIAVLAEDTLAAAAVYVLAEDFSQDQGDELPLVESTSVPSNSVNKVFVAFEAALDQPVCVAVTEDSLVCDIVRGEI